MPWMTITVDHGGYGKPQDMKSVDVQISPRDLHGLSVHDFCLRYVYTAAVHVFPSLKAEGIGFAAKQAGA